MRQLMVFLLLLAAPTMAAAEIARFGAWRLDYQRFDASAPVELRRGGPFGPWRIKCGVTHRIVVPAPPEFPHGAGTLIVRADFGTVYKLPVTWKGMAFVADIPVGAVVSMGLANDVSLRLAVGGRSRDFGFLVQAGIKDAFTAYLSACRAHLQVRLQRQMDMMQRKIDRSGIH